MNKNTKKARDTKKRICETVWELLKKNNLKEITITEICQYSEIGRPSFYRNFKSKEDVLIYIIVNKLEEMLKEVKNLEDLVNDISYFYDVFHSERKFFEYITKENDLYLYLINSISIYCYYRNYNFDIRSVDVEQFIREINKEYLYALNILTYLLMALIDVWLFKEHTTKEELIENTKRLHLSYTPEKVPRYR